MLSTCSFLTQWLKDVTNHEIMFVCSQAGRGGTGFVMIAKSSFFLCLREHSFIYLNPLPFCLHKTLEVGILGSPSVCVCPTIVCKNLPGMIFVSSLQCWKVCQVYTGCPNYLGFFGRKITCKYKVHY